MYGQVLTATTTTAAAAVVLPNTGSNGFLTIAATATLVIGVVATVTSLARLIAKRAYKA